MRCLRGGKRRSPRAGRYHASRGAGTMDATPHHAPRRRIGRDGNSLRLPGLLAPIGRPLCRAGKTMTDALDAPAVGHNRPPEPTPIERASELVANANLWLTTVEEINDADRAGRAQTFVNQLRGNRDDLD